ncbi:MAG: aldo/keto reductase [Abitibacteriaceae bacterium]|nr:aldo/keto reductase [Abditibacteriaceae bacterium]MBV9868031.1 aldo/keto reductase [Abditibacteriaceae bacterium]
MQYRKLAKTDIEVSAVAFGCWAIVGGFNWGPQDEQDSLAALRAAYESGVTFFDTAEGYGNGYSEQLIAKALGNVRDNMVIATKVSPNHFAPEELHAACEWSLRNLNTDRIDLYQLHWPNHEIPIGDTLAILEELKGAGKIRAYGVSNFGPRDLSELLQTSYLISSNQLAYNLLFRAIEHEIQPLCVQADISILCYSPILQGLLAGKFANADEVPDDRARTRHFVGTRPQARHGEAGAETETFAVIEQIRQIAQEIGQPMADVSLAWLLQQPAVTSVITGGRNAEQARLNVRAGDLTLPADVVTRLSAVTESLKQQLGTNADMWQNPSRMR